MRAGIAHRRRRQKELEMNSFASDWVWLDQHTKIEPLVCRWYAWPHLLSPALLALNLAYRYVPLLKSFVANPSIHLASARDPKFLCAPFAQLAREDVDAARELLKEINDTGARFLRFAADLLDLDRKLQAGAKGGSIQPFYAALPESLSGLVELTYDLNHHPNIRLIEELLYDELDTASTQELAFFDAADRPFFLNTPRLPGGGRTLIKLPFRDARVEKLARYRLQGGSLAELCDSLGIAESARSEFRRFFSSEPPPRNAPAYEGDRVRVRYFGHAAVLVQSARTSVMIDPVLAWDAPGASPYFTFHDLPDFIDYVFLTHDHQDHVCLEVLLQLRGRIGRILVARNNPTCLADPAMSLMLKSAGFENVDVIDSLGCISFEDGTITAIPFYGEHADVSMYSKHGMLLNLRGRKFLFVADADCVDRGLYRRIARRTGGVDTLFIGMECYGAPLSWLYGPYFSAAIHRRDDEARRLSGSNAERAWGVVEEMQPRNVFVYAMGQEPWLTHLLGLQYSPESIQITESEAFVGRCRDAGLASERLYGTRELIC
jgi:L-ascorbate metabolism protein UlaG (beta-lactamase superfamily)